MGVTVADFRGLFLRGYGSQSHTKNNGSTTGNTTTTHSSGTLGAVQGDAIREMYGEAATSGQLHGSGYNVFGGMVGPSVYYAGAREGSGACPSGFNFYASRVVPVASEIRPVNMAVRYLVRAK